MFLRKDEQGLDPRSDQARLQLASDQFLALFLGQATPNAGLLLGRDGPVEALSANNARVADRLCAFDLIQSRASGSYREEHIGVGDLAAVGPVSPVGLSGRSRVEVERDVLHSHPIGLGLAWREGQDIRAPIIGQYLAEDFLPAR